MDRLMKIGGTTGHCEMEDYYKFLKEHDAIGELARGMRSGNENQLVRLGGKNVNLPEEFSTEASAIGMSTITTTINKN